MAAMILICCKVLIICSRSSEYVWLSFTFLKLNGIFVLWPKKSSYGVQTVLSCSKVLYASMHRGRNSSYLLVLLIFAFRYSVSTWCIFSIAPLVWGWNAVLLSFFLNNQANSSIVLFIKYLPLSVKIFSGAPKYPINSSVSACTVSSAVAPVKRGQNYIFW